MTDDEISEILLPLMPLKDPYVFARAIAAAEREACARLASDHECGGEDDFICQHQNCGLCIAGAIRLRSNEI